VLHIFALLMASDVPLSNDVEISPAVRDLGRKSGGVIGPAVEQQLAELEKSGDRTAAVLLGELLQDPRHPGGPDFARACDHFEAGGQHSEALHNLGACYYNGQGRAKDWVKARDLYRQAAEKGYAKAACAYGNMLIHGEGGPADVKQGLDLCRRAADIGDRDAETDYAGYLLTNKYLPKNAVEARRYLSLAVDKGQANAALLLGQVYWNGDGVAKDNAMAAKLWTAAYQGGREDAAFFLGNEAIVRLGEELQANRPPSPSIIAEARRWFGITVAKDSNPEHKKSATEALAILDQLEGKTK